MPGQTSQALGPYTATGFQDAVICGGAIFPLAAKVANIAKPPEQNRIKAPKTNQPDARKSPARSRRLAARASYAFHCSTKAAPFSCPMRSRPAAAFCRS